MIESRIKGRLQLIMVGIIFVGPFLVAYFLYDSDSSLIPSAGTEHGVFLDPPKKLPDTALASPGNSNEMKFRTKWSLIVVGGGQCDQVCKDALYETRQVRRALGRDDIRVQRVFYDKVGRPDLEFLRREHPSLIVVEPGSPVSLELIPLLGGRNAGDVFLADPLGYLIMRFPRGTTMKDIHKDMKHLLKVSQIG
jgi:hypothetical protein